MTLSIELHSFILFFGPEEIFDHMDCKSSLLDGPHSFIANYERYNLTRELFSLLALLYLLDLLINPRCAGLTATIASCPLCI